MFDRFFFLFGVLSWNVLREAKIGGHRRLVSFLDALGPFCLVVRAFYFVLFLLFCT